MDAHLPGFLWRSMTGHHRQDTHTRFFRVHREIRIESDFPTLLWTTMLSAMKAG